MDFTPSGGDVLAYLGWEDEANSASASRHVDTVTSMARSYTRGVGFADGERCETDIAAVIITAAARSLANPSQAARIEAGSASEVPARLDGWSLTELAVLHRYRRRAT